MLVGKAERMKAELQKVVIIEPHSVNSDIVSPGTRVTPRHEGKTELETYTILVHGYRYRKEYYFLFVASRKRTAEQNGRRDNKNQASRRGNYV